MPSDQNSRFNAKQLDCRFMCTTVCFHFLDGMSILWRIYWAGHFATLGPNPSTSKHAHEEALTATHQLAQKGHCTGTPMECLCLQFHWDAFAISMGPPPCSLLTEMSQLCLHTNRCCTHLRHTGLSLSTSDYTCSLPDKQGLASQVLDKELPLNCSA